MTIFEKFFEHYPHKKEGLEYEFSYMEEANGIRYVKRAKRTENFFPFKTPMSGEDYTTEPVKPFVPNVQKLGFGYERLVRLYEDDDMFNKVWVSLMTRIVVDNLIMVTPISIHQESKDGWVRTIGYVYVQRKEDL